MAHAPAVDNQPVRKPSPFFRRKQPRQILFDLHWVLLPGKTQAARQPPAMSIHRDAGKVESVAEDHIGGFAPDAGEASQLFHRRRHFAVEFSRPIVARSV